MPAYIGTSSAISARSARLSAQSKRAARSGRTRDGELGEDPPLAAGLAERVGDLRAERDLALGRRARAAALLLVARGRRQQDDVVAVDEHLRRQDDVLVHAQRHAAERRLDPRRVGHHLEQVRAVDEQHVEVAALGGLDHLRRRQPDVARARRSPTARDHSAAWSSSTGSPPGNAVA